MRVKLLSELLSHAHTSEGLQIQSSSVQVNIPVQMLLNTYNTSVKAWCWVYCSIF